MIGYIYETFCPTEDGIKTYIGKRSSTTFDEDYIGSGKILSDWCRKHNFPRRKRLVKLRELGGDCKIIYEAESEDELNTLEKKAISELKPDWNIAKGGTGGDTISGYKWWNNGEKQVYSKECPEGFNKGRLVTWKRPDRSSMNREMNIERWKNNEEYKEKMHKALTFGGTRDTNENWRKHLSESAKKRWAK
jgi:hypothetical protein